MLLVSFTIMSLSSVAEIRTFLSCARKSLSLVFYCRGSWCLKSAVPNTQTLAKSIDLSKLRPLISKHVFSVALMFDISTSLRYRICSVFFSLDHKRIECVLVWIFNVVIGSI